MAVGITCTPEVTEPIASRVRNACRRARIWGGGGRWVALLTLLAALSGCGLAAAPCRVGSAALKIVPLVGHAAATPTDACASVIDPG